MRTTLLVTMWLFVLALIAPAQSVALGQELAAEPDDPTELRAQLVELERKRDEIDAQINEIENALRASRQGAPDEATAAAGGNELREIGEWVEGGDLRLRLHSLDQLERNFNVEKRFDLNETGPLVMDVPMYGLIIEVENTSPGRIATPFNDGNMFGGQANVYVQDSWGNPLVQQALEDSEYEITPGPRAEFVINDHKVMPKSSETFFFPIAEPDVTNVDWFVARVSVDAGSDEYKFWFYIPAEQVSNLGKEL